MRLFQKREERRAQDARADGEIARLKALSTEELAIAVMPGFGRDGANAGRSVRVQQLCEYLLRDCAGAGRSKPLNLLAPVRRAVELLEQAGLVRSASYDRSPLWHLTPLGETTLTDGTVAERIGRSQ